MPNQTIKTLAMLAVLALAAGWTAELSADDSVVSGVVETSSTLQPIPETSSETWGYTGNCQGDCSKDAIIRSQRRRHHSPLGAMLHEEDTYSPDHGWSRVSKRPIRRMPVQYYRWWPNKWYGEPGSGLSRRAPRFPVVHTPTDTTQLGAYYQRVPQWQPNPSMIPPAPWPANWHHRACPGNGHCNANGQIITSGEVIYSDAPSTESAPQPIETPTPPGPTTASFGN